MTSLEAMIILLAAIMVVIGMLMGTLITYIVIQCRIRDMRNQLHERGVAPPCGVSPETDSVTPSAPPASAEPILAAPVPLGWH